MWTKEIGYAGMNDGFRGGGVSGDDSNFAWSGTKRLFCQIVSNWNLYNYWIKSIVKSYWLSGLNYTTI